VTNWTLNEREIVRLSNIKNTFFLFTRKKIAVTLK